MKRFFLLFSFLVVLSLQSCEDTFLNPKYYVECEIDGEKWRAETNNDAFLSWFSQIGKGSYDITGQDVPNDRSIQITLFEELGESTIPAGTNVNSILTNIVFYMDDTSYSALEGDGSGSVTVESLSETETTGSFHGKLVNRNDHSDAIEITNGKYYVKTRN